MAEKQKKLMLLGGLRYLIPVIKAAHKLGIYVITCDYVPSNIAHKYSDEYHNISIVDKEAVLKLAQSLEIDGIMSFAVDPGVITASYVQEKMGLPTFGPYESVKILQNKDLFRKFLTENNFKVPKAKGYSNWEDVENEKTLWEYPIIVKPTDSAGSKGVTKVESYNELKDAVEFALECSISKNIIIEDFIESKGCSSDSDSFSLNGELKFVSFSAQRFDKDAANPYTPSAYSWPSTFSTEQEDELRKELQRLMTLLKMNTSVYNIETRVGKDGNCYIMEVSPRGGGNRLSEMVRYSTGVDLITNAVKACVGYQVDEISQNPLNGHWAEIILHADKDGIFNKITIDDNIRKFIFEEDLWVEKGEKVEAFNGANNAIGTLVLCFNTAEDLENAILNQKNWLKIVVD